MTGTTIPLKKFSVPGLLAWLLLGSSGFAAATFPSLQHIGIIPVQIVGETNTNLDSALEAIDQAVSQTVRQSKRFEVLSDSLIKQMWKAPHSRAQLTREYELSCFFSMFLQVIDDRSIFAARLLSPTLELYLEETTTVRTRDLEIMSYDEILDVISTLTFRLFNRLPVDITITSVQGRYVTLSGGRDQGLHAGDSIHIVRPQVAATHPANRTWLAFKTDHLGNASIIEVTPKTAIGRIDMQTYEGSIRVGDGAKIGNLASRARFQVGDDTPIAIDAPDTILVPPLYRDGPPAAAKHQEALAVASNPAVDTPPPVQTEVTNTEQSTADESQSRGVDHADSTQTIAQAPTLTPPAESRTEETSTQGPYRGRRPSDAWTRFSTGYTGWTYAGPGGTGSKISWYTLINTIRGEYNRPLTRGINYNLAGQMAVGKTTNRGGYARYIVDGSVYWRKYEDLLDGIINKWQAGARAAYHGFGVKSEVFGGTDALHVEGFVDARGAYNSYYDISVRLALKPLMLGRVGHSGEQHTIKSSFGWRLEVFGWDREQRGKRSRGLGTFYESLTLSDSNSEVLTLHNIGLLVAYQLP